MRPLLFCSTVIVSMTTLLGEVRAEPSFTVRRVADDSVAWTGELSAEKRDSRATELPVRMADFSGLTEPGQYYLEVPDYGRSVNFTIGEDVYDGQLVTLMLGFYGWRSGIAIAFDHHGVHYEHQAGHIGDALLDMAGQPGVTQDGTGGWYDAGDYGKYIPTAAQTVGTMLAAWELFSEKLSNLSLPFIPEHGGPLPDYLAELKWELEWMLKMTYADSSGRVHEKINSASFPGFIAPIDDTSPRYFASFSTTATADLVATLAKATRVFRPYDPTFAGRMWQVAQSSYAYLVAHPDYVASDQSVLRAGNYASNDADDRLWAAAEMWQTGGDPAALADFEARAPSTGIIIDFDWDKLQNLGIFTYLLSEREGRDPAVVSRFMTQATNVIADIKSFHDESGYGRGMASFYWGANGIVPRRCMLLQTANKLAPNPNYLDLCADQIGYLYGRNQYHRSMVTGEGIDPPLHPHHRISASDSVDAPYPGLLVGGGTTAVDWRDVQNSASSNEVAINWNAALVYALAGFVQGSSSASSVGPVAAEACGVRLSSIGYLPDRSKVATVVADCQLPTIGPKCAAAPESFSGDTSGPPSMIDDLEDGNGDILESEGRKGSWSAYDDRTGGTRSDVRLEPLGRAGSQYAACISGSGFASWGGGIRFNLNQGASRLVYDASKYTGITFWARGSSDFRVMLVDQYSDSAGGICTSGSCNDHFQVTFTPGPDWQKYTYSWSEFEQLGFGALQPSVCPSALFGIQFQWLANADAEICLDDLGFTTAGGQNQGEGGAGGQGGASGTGTRQLSPTGGGGCDCGVTGTRRPGAASIVLLTTLAVGYRRRRRLRTC